MPPERITEKIFLSCVTAEFARDHPDFGETRQALAHGLRRRGRDVRSEEDFPQPPGDILEALDDFIRQCSVVVQLVGDSLGDLPTVQAIERLHAKFAGEERSFLDKQAEALRTAFVKGGPLTYIQWEALLALHHRIPLFLYCDEKALDRHQAYGDLLALGNPSRYLWTFSSLPDLYAKVIADTHEHLKAVAATLNNLPGSIGRRFKGRADVLREVHTGLHDGAGAITQAIAGLGGIGKTRLAIEYAYAFASEYRATFLLSGDSEATLTTSFTDLTNPRYLNLKDVHAQDSETRYHAVLKWLAENEKWLLIVDNVDTPEARSAIQNRFGELDRGKVLITSRLKSFNTKVRTIPLDLLTPEAARDFFLDRTQRDLADDDPESQELDKLVETLDGLALAIEQAGAYIAEFNVTFAKYILLLAENEKRVLEWDDADLTDYEETVATTWLTTFERLSEEARDILNQTSFLAPEPIPRTIFEPEDTRPDQSVIHELARYSLAEILTDPADTFQVHRLVQGIVQSQLGEKREEIWHRLIAKVKEWAPNGGQDISTWSKWEQFAFHAPAVFGREKEYEDTIDLCSLLSGFAGFELFRNANYEAAERYVRRNLEADERLLGPEHPNTLSSINNLALLLKSKGDNSEAEPLYRRALEATKRVLGPEHRDTLCSLNNLAALLESKGEYEEAEPLHRRALEARERVFGPEHPDTLCSLNNLAALLESKGEYEEAEPLYRRTWEVYERVLGPKHPDALKSVNNLAGLLKSKGEYEEAEPLYRRAWEAYERVLGPEHPDTLTSLNNLAALLDSKGDYEQAEPLYRRALESRERVLGPEHPDTLTSLNNLAALLESKGHYGQAEPLYQQATEGAEKILGKDHPTTEIVRANWQRCLAAMEQKDEPPEDD